MKRKEKSNAQEIKASRKRGFRGVSVPCCGGRALINSHSAIVNAQRRSV
jgi:hypothetical protein